MWFVRTNVLFDFCEIQDAKSRDTTDNIQTIVGLTSDKVVTETQDFKLLER